MRGSPKAQAGKVTLGISHVCLAEVTWVLLSFDAFERAQLATTLRELVLHDGVEIENEAVVLDALDRFGRVKVDFIDCYTGALAKHARCPVVTGGSSTPEISQCGGAATGRGGATLGSLIQGQADGVIVFCRLGVGRFFWRLARRVEGLNPNRREEQSSDTEREIGMERETSAGRDARRYADRQEGALQQG